MSRLDRYIFRAALLPFLLILTCTTAVAWLTQVLQRMDIIVDDGGTLGAFLKITILLIPNLAGVVTPIALLAACIYVLNVLMVDSEIPVMRAAGASRLRVARPLLLLSLLASLLVFYINVDLQPRSYRELRETVFDVRSNIASSLVRDQVFAEVVPGVTFYAEDVMPGDQYVGLHIHDARDPVLHRTYTAENGLFTVNDAGPQLFLLRGTAQTENQETGELNIVRFAETSVDIAEVAPQAPRNFPWEATERYLSELKNPDLSRPLNRRYQGDYRAEYHARLATPFYSIAFAMLPSIFMLGATTQRRGYGKVILITATTALGLRIVGFLARSMAVENPALDIVQYLIPGVTILVCSVLLFNPSRLQRHKRLALTGSEASA